MKRGRALSALSFSAALAALAAGSPLANCYDEGPYEVRQCSVGTWFAPIPPGAGALSLRWWALGFGNATRTAPLASPNVSPEGSGFIGSRLDPDGFIGIDSGWRDAMDLDLVDATSIAGIGAPTGSTCLSSRANWGSPGIDSCIDVNRTAWGPGGAYQQDDDYLNPYFGLIYGPYTYALSSQVDPPMGVLMTESTGLHFALAFFASRPRTPPLERDIESGQLHMDRIINGDPGPTGDNVVPWQRIPQLHVSFVVAADPNAGWNSPRNVGLQWEPVRLVHDGSVRPCYQEDGATPCVSLGGATGVGVLDQGTLVHYQVEMAPVIAEFPYPVECGTTWTVAPGGRVEYPGNATILYGIPRDTCLRLITLFGRTPSVVPCPGACVPTVDFRAAAQQGKMGDIGYEVTSRITYIGGPLVSENIHLASVSRLKGNDLRLVFDTDSELSLSHFEVVGVDGRGGRRIVATIPCEQCTSGLSAAYDVTLDHPRLQGSKSILIVGRPSGRESNVVPLK